MTHTDFYQAHHNHQSCVSNAIRRAKAVCRNNHVRFTPIRRRVLEIVWKSHQPIAAYEILRALRVEKANAEPPTVYRALDFLLENHLIHRLESLNAYTGCGYSGQQHISQFLICSSCQQVAEMDDPELEKLIHKKASKIGFRAHHQTVEITGVCPGCLDR